MFLLLVAAISAGMLALARVIPGAESPERFPGFLVWLPAVWSPNLAALLVAGARGELRELLLRLVPRSGTRRVWIVALAPLAVAAVVVAVAAATGRGAHWDRLGPVVLLLLFAINLPLGPLGEELGWRGFLQPRLDARLGAERSALVVGGVWALWHLPLWTIDSPQSQIPFLLFAAHVLCYSLTLSALVRRAGGWLLPAVIFHLLVNVVTGAAAIAELADPATWFAWSLPVYALAAAWSWRALARPASRRGRAWRALRSAAGIALAAAAGAMLAWALARPHVPAVRDQRGRPVPGHVATIERPVIGGVEQAVVLRGRCESLPIVLFVHGGPGTPETPMLLEFVPELSEHVLLAAWEQRGAGKSFSRRVPAGSLTIEQMTRDLHEVTGWLLERFDRCKPTSSPWRARTRCRERSAPRGVVKPACTGRSFHVNTTNMKSGSPRQYRQKARAEAAERTRQAIMRAAVTLWREQDWEQVTLGAIAERAGVTVQTVLRRFGSKEGIVDTCLAERASGVEEVRDQAQTGDVASAIEALLAHYERDGDAVLRTLGIERRSPAARRIVAHGRAEHRAWCARVFAPQLPSPRARSYRARLDAFVAATDIYVWKLLRRDLVRTRQQTKDALAALLGGMTATPARGRQR